MFKKYPVASAFLLLLIILVIFDLSLGTMIPKTWDCREQSNYYHHGLTKNCSGKTFWGAESNEFFTNSLGMKDKYVRDVPLSSDNYRILFLGDSFTEGVGLPYQKTFVGLMDDRLKYKGLELLNSSVVSYSPKLYYYRLRYLLELGLKINEVVICVDISDVQDEIQYKTFNPDAGLSKVTQINTFLRNHFYSYRTLLPYVAFELRNIFGPVESKQTPQKNLWNSEKEYYDERDKWDHDPVIYEKWGREGQELALKSMTLLADLCKTNRLKFSIVIYPWPSLVFRGNLSSRYVSLWESFARSQNIPFINLIPLFLNEETALSIKKNFIPGDVHFSEDGHKKVAECLETLILERFQKLQNSLDQDFANVR